ncbi:MAG TPA: rRNA maturation RNase YbeY [Chthoniobacterales bacterium]|jgi:probable rRNA maturation factor|nr:rRNA maturation RNase YbeY [Chthoniobacterales bacterium]
MKSTNAPRIVVRNLQRKVAIKIVDLATFAQKAAAFCLQVPHKGNSKLRELPEISVVIVSDAKIAKLHRQFMNESGPTDVITFQHGEIFISAEMARRNARRFGNPLQRELRLYIVHGLLHLHGLDDRTVARAREMEAVQGKVLRQAEL